MFSMNPEQINGLIRQFLPFFGGIAAALGWTWFDGLSATLMAAIGPIMALVSAIWSLVNKQQANLVKMAANVPSVERITMAPTPDGKAIANPAVTPPNVSVSTGINR